MPSETEATQPLRVGVLLSGSGRSLQNLLDLSAAGELPIEIKLVISSRTDAFGLERARTAGVPTCVIARRDTPAETFDQAITDALVQADVDLVCMAGFMSLWTIPERFAGRVMNIHPALLPDFGGKGFYGDRVHQAVIDAGGKITGCTVHFADNEYDHGPIIVQRTVPVLDDDTPKTLAARVFEQETLAYPEAIRLFAAGRLRITGSRVSVRGEPDPASA